MNDNDNYLFIYGIYIENSFKTLKYNSLFSIHVQATKELYILIQQQQTTINSMLSRIAILESDDPHIKNKK